MNEWIWNGARWWKFDFHAHTPASSDYGRGHRQQELRQQSPKEWLLAYMRAEVDCVAVTDHNSGEWIDRLNAAIEELKKDVLNGNRYVRNRVVPYGAGETVESEFRELLQRGEGGFEKDIGSPNGEGLLGQLYGNNGDAADIERNLANIKDTIKKINLQQYDTSALADKRFATHVGKLPPETIDRLQLWFPEDSLEVQYSATDDEQDFRPIEAGSPGQKTAALLAFLLSYGEEPLILDQPEDDLDNHLIYELIVTQLREVKRRRQVIVVTHNANIVVNGDAELVVALAARRGETQLECEGSLQEQPVRDTICEVMEGGREAFEDRYRRIALGARHV